MQRVGAYTVRREIARGAMGVVYEGYDEALERAVAIKVLSHQELTDAEGQARFRREVQIVARLRHPHVIGVHAAGVSPSGFPYVVMDLLRGGSLEERAQGETIPTAEAVRLVAQLSSALDYAHRQGVVHRDVKPANVLLGPQGEAVLTDFGLAKVLETGAGGLTRSGDRLGTPAYMAPEQAMGDLGSVGPASDIYALGVVLYRLICGEVPFRGKSVIETFDLIASSRVRSLRERGVKIDPELDRICTWCLSKNPSERPFTAGELERALDRWLEQAEGLDSRGLPVLARAPTRAPARPWQLGVALLVGALPSAALGVWAGVQLSAGPKRDPSKVPTSASEEDVKVEELSQAGRRLYERGEARLERDDWVGAREDFSALCELEPRSSDAWHCLGRALRGLKEYPAARTAQERAGRLDPSSGGPPNELGLIASSLKEHEVAIERYTEAIARGPHSGISRFNRAISYLSLETEAGTQLGIADLRRCLEIDPRFNLPREQLYAHTSKAEQAALVAEGLALIPDDGGLLYLRMHLLKEAKDWEGALVAAAAYLKAVDDLRAEYFNIRGLVNEGRERSDLAQEDFELTLALDPDNYAGRFLRSRYHEVAGRYREALVDLKVAASKEKGGTLARDSADRLEAALARGRYRTRIQTAYFREASNDHLLSGLAAGAEVQGMSETPDWIEILGQDQEGSYRGFVPRAHLELIKDPAPAKGTEPR